MICKRIEYIACYENDFSTQCCSGAACDTLRAVLKRERKQHDVTVEKLENEIELLEAKLLAANSNIFMLTQK